jgi:hypothetical protein
MKLLMVDNYDSFTYNIVQYFGELGAEVEVVRNDEIDIAGIGERIEQQADAIVAADDYVASIQPGLDETSRHEQGVMVSMVDASGALIPEQRGERSVTPNPTLIRRGLAVDVIMSALARSFPSWDYRHGEYY